MSDDFPFDDIVLDADALAILDAEESKYFGTIANAQPNLRPSLQPTPRPAKRRRTDNDGGWNHSTPGIGGGGGKLVSQNQKRSDSFYDDLPNISLAGDGIYGVCSQGSQPHRSSNIASSSAKNVKNPLGQRYQAAGPQQTAPAPVPVPAPLPHEHTSNLNQNRPPPRPPPQQRTHTPPLNNPNNVNRPQSQYQRRQQQPHPNQVRGPILRVGPDLLQPNRPQNLGPGGNVNVPRQQPVQQQARHVSPTPSRFPNAPGDSTVNKDVHDEIARLKAQLEQVRAWRHHLSSGSLISPFCDGV